MAVLLAVLLSLVVAAVVILLAVATGRAGAADDAHPGLWQAFRAGWRSRRRPDADQREAAQAAAAEPVDVSLAEFLQATTDHGQAYLQVDDLAASLERAARRAQPRRRGA
ncbi:hypothetical protein [Cellulomonas biazotea]|uniref:Uncharacterized protein n=1 Tax=Cellulomonas biazotea TaxID=1709 RepID=A0A402DVA8_9CELL|nr:hypothetical protein [Cellulomonas biazotea]GCE78071.1 hypothetical protein CBZ_31270 [Cellulomonas biazotea]